MSEGEAKPTQYLSLDAILGADDLEERDVAIPAWGGVVRIRALSRASVRRIYDQANDGKGTIDNQTVERGLICQSLVNPIVSPAAFARLDEKQAGAVDALVAAIMDLSAISADAQERARKSFRRQP